MSQPLADLQLIRDQYYLNPDEFRHALHNDTGVLKEDELLYLNRLVETESKISDSVEEWAETWKQYNFSSEELSEISVLLLEILGPLTPQAKQEIAQHIHTHFPAELIHKFPDSLQKNILPRTPEKIKGYKYLPWLIILLAVGILVSGKYFMPEILYPLGALLGGIGGVWLYLRG